MDIHEEIARHFEQLSEDLEMEIRSWTTSPRVELSLHDQTWSLGDFMRRVGDGSTWFEAWSLREKLLVHSIDLSLNGTGHRFSDFYSPDEDTVPKWTLPQQQIIEKAGVVFDTLLNFVGDDVERFEDFLYHVQTQHSVAIPEPLEDFVCEIALAYPAVGQGYIDYNQERSFDPELYLDELYDRVIEGTWRVSEIAFVTHEGDCLGTDGHVAWPVAEEARFLVTLFTELTRTRAGNDSEE